MKIAYSKDKKERKLSRAQILAKILVEKWRLQDEEKAIIEVEKIKKRLLDTNT